MADHSTTVTTEFVGATTTPADISLVLEQRGMLSETGGVLTPSEIAAANGLSIYPTVDWGYFSSDIDEIYELYYAQCGKGGDGSISATIYVLPSPPNLNYKLVANSGEFGERVTESIPKEETIQFNMTSAVNLGYTPDEIESIAWEGDTYNSSGSVVYASTPVLSGNSLVTNQEVFGSCRIKYSVFGHTYVLTVPMRDDNSYQSTVMAFYGSNQVETLDVTFSDMSDQCPGGYSVTVNAGEDGPGDDPEVPPDEDEDDSVSVQFVAYDSCTGDVISPARFVVEGHSSAATGSTYKRGVTYSVTASADGYKTNSKSFSL